MSKLIFDHIGIACKDIAEMLTYMDKFFQIEAISEIIYDAKQNANICMVTLQDQTRVELISGEVVAQILKKRNYLYHTCYTVDNLNEAIAQFEEEGSFLISEPKPAILFNGRKVAFLTSNLGMIELLERKGVDIVDDI